jgi:hypothetical protein
MLSTVLEFNGYTMVIAVAAFDSNDALVDRGACMYGFFKFAETPILRVGTIGDIVALGCAGRDTTFSFMNRPDRRHV